MKSLVLAGGLPQIDLLKKLKARGIYILLADYLSAEPITRASLLKHNVIRSRIGRAAILLKKRKTNSRIRRENEKDNDFGRGKICSSCD